MRIDHFEQSASGKNTRLVHDEVSITQVGYVCVKQLKIQLIVIDAALI